MPRDIITAVLLITAVAFAYVSVSSFTAPVLAAHHVGVVR